jgi:hypothetical protein
MVVSITSPYGWIFMGHQKKLRQKERQTVGFTQSIARISGIRYSMAVVAADMGLNIV